MWELGAGARGPVLALGAGLGALLCACGAPPAHVVPGKTHPQATGTAVASVPVVTNVPVIVTKAAPRSRKAVGEDVQNAYDLRAKGDVAGARAALEAIVKELVEEGAAKTPGLGTVDGEVVRGRTTAGLSGRESREAWFFEVESGEPFALGTGVVLRRGAPALDGGLFAAEAGASLELFDPAKKAVLSLPGNVIALHPDGHRVYLLGEDCRLREWSLSSGPGAGSPGAPSPSGAVTRELEAHYRGSSAAESGSRMECDPYGLRDAAVTADGKWLTTRFARWDLATGKKKALPFNWDADDYAPAVSPDGRYVAHVTRKTPAPKDPLAQEWVIALTDLDSRVTRTSRDSVGFLSNGDPLSFEVSPLRVCVFDYGIQIFEVPTLRRFVEGDPGLLPPPKPLSFGPKTCEARFVPPPPAHPDLRARLASRVCEVGGWLFPVESCGG